MTITAAPPSRWGRAAIKVPPRVVLYGTGGVGKTTAACAFPNAMVAQTENGLGNIDVPHTGLLQTYSELVDSISELFDAPRGTFVLDSLDHLEPLVWAETCARSRPVMSDIEAFGYGKGYLAAEAVWRELLAGLNALNQRGWAIVLIAHSQITTFNDPSTESYDRYSLKLHKRAAALVEEWADVIGFAHHEARIEKRGSDKNAKSRATGTGHRVLALEETPSFKAKNRYSLPPLLGMDPLGHNLLNALVDAGAALPTNTTAPIAQEA